MDRTSIERLIPHRPPFLLLDAIDRVDLDAAILRGSRYMQPNDPVFSGHFPGDPVYPGVLQLEMIGQAACCLASLAANQTLNPGSDTMRISVRGTHVHRAMMFSGVSPGETVSIYAAIVDQDALALCAAGQVFAGDRLCAACLLEACFVD